MKKIKNILFSFLLISTFTLVGCEKSVGDHLEDAGDNVSDAAEQAGDNVEDAVD